MTTRALNRPLMDFFLEVARGNMPGMSTVVLRGHNPSQTAASGFVDVNEFGNLTYLSSAETMNIVSSSTDDDAGGTGALTVLIAGVSDTGVAQTEIIVPNGTTDVLTTLSYLRVNTMVVLTAGSTESNVGTITATASSAATIQQRIGATSSISASSNYTVPADKTLHVMQLEFNCTKASGGTAPVVEFHAMARPGGAARAWIRFFDKKIDAAVSVELDVILPFPTSDTQLIERSDFRIEADTDQNTTESSTRMYGILIDNEGK